MDRCGAGLISPVLWCQLDRSDRKGQSMRALHPPTSGAKPIEGRGRPRGLFLAPEIDPKTPTACPYARIAPSLYIKQSQRSGPPLTAPNRLSGGRLCLSRGLTAICGPRTKDWSINMTKAIGKKLFRNTTAIPPYRLAGRWNKAATWKWVGCPTDEGAIPLLQRGRCVVRTCAARNNPTTCTTPRRRWTAAWSDQGNDNPSDWEPPGPRHAARR